MNGKNTSADSILEIVINPLVCHRRLSCTILLISVSLCEYFLFFSPLTRVIVLPVRSRRLQKHCIYIAEQFLFC